MRIKLERHWTERLIKLPESGMGYQRVDVRLSDGRELKDLVVFNAEDLELPDEIGPATIVDVRPRVAATSPAVRRSRLHDGGPETT